MAAACQLPRELILSKASGVIAIPARRPFCSGAPGFAADLWKSNTDLW